MGSENLHAPRERLSSHTLAQHHAIVSVIEEMDAVDWYRQRADDCEDAALRAILLHNMREEIEHACMAIEWLRRNDPDWAEQLKTYLFTDAPITEVEDEAVGTSEDGDGRGAKDQDAPSSATSDGPANRFTIGKLD
jgi:ferritin-like protein